MCSAFHHLDQQNWGLQWFWLDLWNSLLPFSSLQDITSPGQPYSAQIWSEILRRIREVLLSLVWCVAHRAFTSSWPILDGEDAASSSNPGCSTVKNKKITLLAYSLWGLHLPSSGRLDSEQATELQSRKESKLACSQAFFEKTGPAGSVCFQCAHALWQSAQYKCQERLWS